MNTQLRWGYCRQAEFFAPVMSQLLKDVTAFIERLETRLKQFDAQVYANLIVDTHPEPTIGVNKFYARLYFDFQFDNWQDVEKAMESDQQMWDMTMQKHGVTK